MPSPTPPPDAPARQARLPSRHSRESGKPEPPAVRIETVVGGETMLMTAGSVRELRDALERGDLDHTPLAKPRP